MTTQRFLFLQGVRSPFFPRLGLALRAAGHSVRKINFAAGDGVYWRIGESMPFRGSMADLPAFYDQQYAAHGVTDVVLFGDCRPVHRPAVERARAAGIRIHVFEEGYFRPYWVTLERDGVNGNSRLPRDPAWYREQARAVPRYDNGQPFASPFWLRAVHDVGYNFWAGLNPILYPRVRSHVPYSPAAEYLGYLGRACRLHLRARCDAATIARLLEASQQHPYYLVPLQLATDAQIVDHSPFPDMATALHEIMASFARHAPADTRLAVKLHPLDPGMVNYARRVKRWAQEYDIADRVFYLESGPLPELIGAAHGVVTVNSTVGASAILHHRPTIALGDAIYRMPGLTCQTSLDDFWQERRPPDIRLFHDFRNVVIHRTQVNGGFYCSRGISAAVERSLQRMTASPD